MDRQTLLLPPLCLSSLPLWNIEHKLSLDNVSSHDGGTGMEEDACSPGLWAKFLSSRKCLFSAVYKCHLQMHTSGGRMPDCLPGRNNKHILGHSSLLGIPAIDYLGHLPYICLWVPRFLYTIDIPFWRHFSHIPCHSLPFPGGSHRWNSHCRRASPGDDWEDSLLIV